MVLEAEIKIVQSKKHILSIWLFHQSWFKILTIHSRREKKSKL